MVTSDDLNKRSYVTFYFNDERQREYHGKNIGQGIGPNRAKSIEERNQLLKRLRFELQKALEANKYPFVENKILEKSEPQSNKPAIRLLFEAVRDKLRSALSKTYKRDLKSVYREFRDFMLPEESNGLITNITSVKLL